jgi:hypothetical protein
MLGPRHTTVSHLQELLGFKVTQWPTNKKGVTMMFEAQAVTHHPFAMFHTKTFAYPQHMPSKCRAKSCLHTMFVPERKVVFSTTIWTKAAMQCMCSGRHVESGGNWESVFTPDAEQSH